MNPINKNITK